MTHPLITVVIPSLNQGRFLQAALSSVFDQAVPLEVFVMDAGSTDETASIIEQWAPRLSGWRSAPDAGQAAAINEGVASGTAPFVTWLNSDDFLYSRGLQQLHAALQAAAECPFAYGRCWTVSSKGARQAPYLTLPFSPRVLANFCFIAQPATLVRRDAWEAVGGLREDFDLAFDYDLWWRLFRRFGPPARCSAFVAATRRHAGTKTATRTGQHYDESRRVVREHWGKLPLKWRLAEPFVRGLRRLGF